MNRPVATRVLESLNKYVPVVKRLGEKHPEFSRTIDLVKLAVNGLAKYYGLFILDQHEKLIRAARLEDDYSRHVTLIGRDLKAWARNPDLTLQGKIGLTRLYTLLERCLRDALELYTQSERELIGENTTIYMSTSDAYGEHERARAALWKFQHDFHMYQIDLDRGPDRAITYGQPGFAGPPAGFGNSEIPRHDWREPDENSLRVLTKEEQEQLKSFLRRPEVQRLLPRNLRNPNVGLPPSVDDNGGDRVTRGPSKKIGPLVQPKDTYMKRTPGILRDPRIEGPRVKPKKKVRWRSHEEPPLPSDNVDDDSPPVIYEGTGPRHSEPELIVCFGPPPTAPPEPPRIVIESPTPIIPSSPPPRQPSSPSRESPTPPRSSSPIPVERDTKRSPLFSADAFGFVGVVDGTRILDDPPSAVSSSSSSSSSSSLPSVGSLSPTLPSSPTEDGDESDTASNSSEDEHTTTSPTSDGSEEREERPRARTQEEVGREVALSVRAYLGRRHDEYGVALAADPDTDFDEDATEIGDEDDTESGDQSDTEAGDENDTEAGDDAEDLPYDDETWAAHLQLSHTARQNTAHDISGTALLHWAGVSKAKREERIEGHARLRTILKWAEREGKVPLSPSSIRATTGLRRSLFTPLGSPDLPPPTRRSRRRDGPEAYREATLENLEQLRPRLDLTLLAFLHNEDALRLFGGLVGEQPLPRDLARMDKVLRELEVYTTVCAHRRRLIVDHLKRTRKFPLTLPAQSGDLRAALHDAEEAKLSAARRCFEYVAERSRHVMTYPGGKRRRREFRGQFGPRERERLEYLSGVDDDDASALRAELEEAEEWQAWCAGVMGEWELGWRPGRVEKEMLYVDEETQADVRRYQWEINQKRAAIGLVPVKRPQDEVYERQQEHIRLLDGLWKLMT